MQRLSTKSKQFKLNQLNFFAIPLMAITALGTIGIMAVAQDTDYDASATNATVDSKISYKDEYITISNPSVIDLSTEEVTANDTYVYATNSVTVSTNVETGYELYLNSANKTSAALTADNGYGTKINPTSGTGGELGTPAVLGANTYGYAVASGTIGNTKFDSDYTTPTSSSKWAAVPVGAPDRIRAASEAKPNGEVTEVHYGANVNNALAPGEYTNQVIYSAVVTPTSGTYAMSVSPSEGAKDGGTTLTINSGPTTINTAANLDASEVEVYFRQSGTTKGKCTVTNVSVTSGHLVTTCTSPALALGTYDVMISVPRYGFKDTKASAFAIPTMQDFTSTQCSNLTEATNKTLFDARDGNAYTIRKLKDNHCWMVQNLRLIDKTISSSDSDIFSGSFTIPTSISGSGTDRWCRSDDANCGDRSLAYYGNNTTYGAYYNWYTATAGTGTYAMSSGDATSSICPKGWKLPKGDETNHSWYNLYANKYGFNISNFQSATLTGSGYYAGYMDNGSLNTVGSYGLWWSRTASSSSNAYSLYTDSGYINPQGNFGKYVGLSVRCVLIS